MEQSRFLISVLGPTAIGKTSLSIEIAKHFKTEIVSTDSRQFYQEMNIGTAVPSEYELNAVPHHFIQNISIQDDYSVGKFENEASIVLNSLFNSHPQVVLVGGSGLFHKAIVEGLDDFPELDSEIRKALNKQLISDGIETLQEQLKTLDPLSYQKLDLNNPQRVIRALEVSISSGKPFSSYKTSNKKNRNFTVLNIGLTADRELIYDRINQRVDQMIDEGLVEEAKELHKFKHLNALNTVGYKELFEYFEGKNSLEETIERIKMNTRRFAKRQLTWFRKDPSIKWFDYKTESSVIINYLEGIMAKKNPA